MKYKVGDKVFWQDTTIGAASGVVGMIRDGVLWTESVVGRKSGPVDTTEGWYPVYPEDRPSKRAPYQNVGTWPFDNRVGP